MSTIEIFENERAFGYDDFVHTWIPNYKFFIDNLPALLSDQQSDPLLVVGCGTGNEMYAFKKYDQNWQLTGVDPSPDMISQAQNKLRDRQAVQLVEGEVKDLPATDRFGAATLLLVLHFLKDNGTKLQLLRDIAERMESGSPLVLFDIFGGNELLKHNLNLLQHFIKNVSEEDKQERLKRIESHLHPLSEDRLSALLQKAGFQVPKRFYQTTIYGGWIAYRQ
ncbi:MAG: class I SAM-dependent methyltransferase [Bacteroidota bacterium]